MSGPARWRALGILALAALTGACLPGCFCHVKQEDPVLKAQKTLGQAMPLPCRSHCFLFFMHGCDPIDCINLSGMVERLQDLGYIKTYEGEFFHTGWFAKEIKRIHKEDATARFVVIGDGMGAGSIQRLAHLVQEKSINIDLLVALNGKVAKEGITRNVLQVVNVQGKNAPGDSEWGDHAVNVVIPDVAEFGLATHPQVMELVLRELLQVASRVPVIDKALPANPHPEPTPRPVKPAPAGPRDAWDFLLPESRSTPKQPGGKAPAQPAPASPPAGGGPPVGTKLP